MSRDEIARRAWWGSPADIYLIVDNYERLAGTQSARRADPAARPRRRHRAASGDRQAGQGRLACGLRPCLRHTEGRRTLRRSCCPARSRRARSTAGPGHRPAARPRRLGAAARSGRDHAGDTRSTGMVMEPLDPASGARPEARRPLLMDPAGARPSGFAPPSVLGHAGRPAAPAGPPAAVGRQRLRSAGIAPSAPRRCWPDRRRTGDRRRCPVRHRSARSARWSGSVCGPCPRGSTWCCRTARPSPRPWKPCSNWPRGRCASRRSRTAAGSCGPRPASRSPGSVTLLDQGIVDGATLFLTGIDAADSAAVYDDVADAVADTVLTDPSAWPAGGGRAVALGAAGLFGGARLPVPAVGRAALDRRGDHPRRDHRRAGPGGGRAALPRWSATPASRRGRTALGGRRCRGRHGRHRR